MLSNGIVEYKLYTIKILLTIVARGYQLYNVIDIPVLMSVPIVFNDGEDSMEVKSQFVVD